MYYVLIAWKIEFVYSKYWFTFCSYRNFDTSLFICLIRARNINYEMYLIK